MSEHFKACTACRLEKPIEDFQKIKRIKSGYGPRCKKCTNMSHNAWRTPEYSRNSNLKKSFNITSEDYEVMLKEHGHVCAICMSPETAIRQGKLQHLSVDHNHSTGKIRGLLCNSCNRALGKFGDSLTILKNAVLYLEVTDG